MAHRRALPHVKRAILTSILAAAPGMSPGKIAAQCSHAALGAQRVMMERDLATCQRWEMTGEAIIVLRVDSGEHLQQLLALADSKGLSTHSVCDAGRTEVESGTTTVGAIGPAFVSKIDEVTGKLMLL